MGDLEDRGAVSLFDCRIPSDVTGQHVIDLVGNDVPEDEHIDYKQELPGRGPYWKRKKDRDVARADFLHDVCAMANAAGGWLVYGVSEEKGPDGRLTGHPKDHIGVSDCRGLDSERLRLEDDVRRYIVPTLSGFWVRPIRKRREFVRGPIFVARVPSTWSGPFMVTYRDRTDFKRRGRGGNYAMTYEEIRNDFTLGDEVLDRARSLRGQSAREIAGLDGSQVSGFLTVLWVVSLPSLRMPQVDGLVATALKNPPRLITPLSGFRTHANLDGVVVHGHRARIMQNHQRSDATYSSGYVQVYRNGVIRAVDSFAHCDYPPETIEQECALGFPEAALRTVHAQTLERRLKSALSEYLSFLTEADAPPPFAVMLTLQNTKDVTFQPTDINVLRPSFDEKNVEVPAFVVDRSEDTAEVVGNVMDIVWQAAHFPGRM
jgi:Putative DNA-binding domain